MANEATITIVGNLTDAPELRYTQSGHAVANFTIASTPKTFDKASNEWKDGEALFLRASCWREFAEHVAGSLAKGSRVVATGKLKSRSYETQSGEKRTSMELDVDEIGPSLRYATAVVTRSSGSERSQAGAGGTNTAPGDSYTPTSEWGATGGAQSYTDSTAGGVSDVPF